jgi:hypothetical protein
LSADIFANSTVGMVGGAPSLAAKPINEQRSTIVELRGAERGSTTEELRRRTHNHPFRNFICLCGTFLSSRLSSYRWNKRLNIGDAVQQAFTTNTDRSEQIESTE